MVRWNFNSREDPEGVRRDLLIAANHPACPGDEDSKRKCKHQKTLPVDELVLLSPCPAQLATAIPMKQNIDQCGSALRDSQCKSSFAIHPTVAP